MSLALYGLNLVSFSFTIFHSSDNSRFTARIYLRKKQFRRKMVILCCNMLTHSLQKCDETNRLDKCFESFLLVLFFRFFFKTASGLACQSPTETFFPRAEIFQNCYFVHVQTREIISVLYCSSEAFQNSKLFSESSTFGCGRLFPRLCTCLFG